MYEFESRIRFSETNSEKTLTLRALIDYFQDCSTFQSEDLGVGLDYMLGKKQAWVVNYWQIDLIKMPKLGEKVKIGTIPYELKSFMGFRNFYMKDAMTGEMLAKANSVWTLIDIENVRPARVDAHMVEAFKIEDRLEMEYTERKIELTGETASVPSIKVMKHHLDSNNHVNNCQYIQMALNLLPEEQPIKRLRTEYRKSAYLSDTIYPVTFMNENSFGVSLNDENDDAYVKVLFEFE